MRKQFYKGLLFFIIAQGNGSISVIHRVVKLKVEKVKRLLLILLIIVTLISYASVWVSPASFKYAAGVSILIPVFLILNIFSALFLAYKRSIKAILPVLVLILGYPFF